MGFGASSFLIRSIYRALSIFTLPNGFERTDTGHLSYCRASPSVLCSYIINDMVQRMENAQPNNTKVSQGFVLYQKLGGESLQKAIPFLLNTHMNGDVLILTLPLWTLYIRQGATDRTLNIDVYRNHSKGEDQIANQLVGVPFKELPLVITRL